MASYTGSNERFTNTINIDVSSTQTLPTGLNSSPEFVRDRMLSVFSQFPPQIQLGIVCSLEEHLLRLQPKSVPYNESAAPSPSFNLGLFAGQNIPSTDRDNDIGRAYQAEVAQDYNMSDYQDPQLALQHDNIFRYDNAQIEHPNIASQAIIREPNTPLSSIGSRREPFISVATFSRPYPSQDNRNSRIRHLQHNRGVKLSRQAMLNRASNYSSGSESSMNSIDTSGSSIRWSGSSSDSYNSATPGFSPTRFPAVPSPLGAVIPMPLNTSTLPRTQTNTTQPSSSILCTFGCGAKEFGRPGERDRHEKGCDRNPNPIPITCLLCPIACTASCPKGRNHSCPYKYPRSDKMLEHLKKKHNLKVNAAKEKVPESWRWPFVESDEGPGWACRECGKHLGTWASKEDMTTIRNHSSLCEFTGKVKQGARSNVDWKRSSIQSPPFSAEFEGSAGEVVNYNDEYAWG